MIMQCKKEWKFVFDTLAHETTFKDKYSKNYHRLSLCLAYLVHNCFDEAQVLFFRLKYFF